MYVRPILPQTEDVRTLRDAVQKELDRLAVEFRALQDGRLVGIRYGTAPPTQGKNAQGDVLRNSVPALSAGQIIWGWLCVTGGEPGSWVELRMDAAAAPLAYPGVGSVGITGLVPTFA